LAAFTTFSDEALRRFLVMFDFVELKSCEPIQAGIENSNYYVCISDNHPEYVLTITEDLSFDEVSFFNDLLHLMARTELPVPDPIRTLDGMSSSIFCSKPTWLFPRLPGTHPEKITASHCYAIGRSLAILHETAKSAKYERTNPYDLVWIKTTLAQVATEIDDASLAALTQILAAHEQMIRDEPDLPRGIIHGDLFRDNTLFVDNELTGILDFYHACEDYLIQDIAITQNDWCRNDAGGLDQELSEALLQAYTEVRPLTQDEQRYLPLFHQLAALRFSLTRLLSGSDGEYLKDPEEFLDLARMLVAGSR
jgi:homoserine kinase type II